MEKMLIDYNEPLQESEDMDVEEPSQKESASKAKDKKKEPKPKAARLSKRTRASQRSAGQQHLLRPCPSQTSLLCCRDPSGSGAAMCCSMDAQRCMSGQSIDACHCRGFEWVFLYTGQNNSFHGELTRL